MMIGETMNGKFKYLYQAIVTKIYDGDSITVNLSFGMNRWEYKKKIRFYGINTPELRGPGKKAGLISKKFVVDALSEHKKTKTPIILETKRDKRGKYGRLIATVWYEKDGEWVDLNQELLDNGLAVEYMK